MSSPPVYYTGYAVVVESEEEDQPRDVLDFNGNGGVFPRKRSPIARVQQAIARTRAAMGSGDSGVWTGTIFVPPPGKTPAFVFPSRRINSTTGVEPERFCIRRRFVPTISPLRTMMIYTDGACSSNGQSSPRAGFGFVLNAHPRGGSISAALERKGPTGQTYNPTSNRAELRAVIAALNFRWWSGEGWHRVVIVTDSEYVCNGATIWLRNWARRGWRTSSNGPVANRDLWAALSARMGEYAEEGCEISFWRVPRAQNALADAAANAGKDEEVPDEFMDIAGILC